MSIELRKYSSSGSGSYCYGEYTVEKFEFNKCYKSHPILQHEKFTDISEIEFLWEPFNE